MKSKFKTAILTALIGATIYAGSQSELARPLMDNVVYGYFAPLVTAIEAII